MDLDTLRYLLLLRPFIVFLAAAPLLALAALVGWYQKRRHERSAVQTEVTEAVLQRCSGGQSSFDAGFSEGIGQLA